MYQFLYKVLVNHVIPFTKIPFSFIIRIMDIQFLANNILISDNSNNINFNIMLPHLCLLEHYENYPMMTLSSGSKLPQWFEMFVLSIMNFICSRETIYFMCVAHPHKMKIYCVKFSVDTQQTNSQAFCNDMRGHENSCGQIYRKRYERK